LLRQGSLFEKLFKNIKIKKIEVEKDFQDLLLGLINSDLFSLIFLMLIIFCFRIFPGEGFRKNNYASIVQREQKASSELKFSSEGLDSDFLFFYS